MAAVDAKKKSPSAYVCNSGITVGTPASVLPAYTCECMCGTYVCIYVCYIFACDCSIPVGVPASVLPAYTWECM